MKPNLITYLCFILLVACSKTSDEIGVVIEQPDTENTSNSFKIQGAQILLNGNPVHFKGVNALQTYGLTEAAIMNEWKVEIVREFIGNLREQPIEGDAILASDGVWYHSLKKIVEQNRANNKITILCPFGWVNETGERTLFTGLNPSAQEFFEDYKVKMQNIAMYFKGQDDVWLEVWNEPYHWNNENGYDHDLWYADMSEMVANLRTVDGFDNIIVVPGNEQGQAETVLLEKAAQFSNANSAIIYDLHAYEKWLENSNQTSVTDRIQRLTDAEIPILFGEVGIQNVGDVMPVQHFLNAVHTTQTTTMAWLWNQNSEDNSALLTDEGQPNNTTQNNAWGTTFRTYLAQ
ncbi:glycoside hydrolase family 5 protein [Croceivirga thetidis]|uniref:Glycoside hydrolase family 5 protein n=1 Tax=Croceivirga thetidis TaxID=2721623 RepID=A0ABX1GKU2_9FLAO|nr:glycoside hydrolase family 5 protein [Croceivirga thetidis]NKI30515.1 glycoside hydrolase family 5 protein [Croceivirga thetidis]